ncbi:dihydrodipicolinate synthase family protein [Streptomyces radicis]|uniref:Dihydrodipicolinate synthase family protein n=1 Tax=Streptomyces radicis TaxID=1750517 RepID=A0A3A9W4Q0_9ACTN|nr:dihydrodipicolinate synthase family protein [Streptomyces radicis]RKN08161.1 dihydrodipicolinate synthase family protein [Streptomyces radicis]RKN20516.1 dihydrodipicolinate synthase family protein [Streptomyces radicis]
MSDPLRLTGVIPPVCTPFTPDGELDTGSLLRLVDHLMGAGVDGLFVLGSSSEAAFLTDRARRAVTEAVVAHVGGALPVLAGAIDMTTPRVLDHARAAVAAGADAIVATAPFYTRTHPAEIERHYRLIAEAAGVPVVAYDLPTSVGTKLPTDVVLRLAADGVLAGLKDSSGDEGALREVVRGRAPGFSVLTGSELLVDTAMLIGADGAVPGLGNVDPAGYVRVHRACVAGDWAAARAEQERLAALFAIVGVGSPARMGRGAAGIGAFKAALRLRGVIDHATVAEPQTPLTDEETALIAGHLTAAGLL